jgi:hypothetical protein
MPILCIMPPIHRPPSRPTHHCKHTCRNAKNATEVAKQDIVRSKEGRRKNFGLGLHALSLGSHTISPAAAYPFTGTFLMLL